MNYLRNFYIFILYVLGSISLQTIPILEITCIGVWTYSVSLQRCDFKHFLLREFKIEYIEIFLDSAWGNLLKLLNCNLSHIVSIHFQNFWIIFHVSFFVIKWLNISHFEKWNILLLCFIFSFMFHFLNTEGALSRSLSVFESLPQGFWIAPTVFLFFSLSVFKNETLKLKVKHKSRIFQFSKVLIINKLKHKNETWNIKYAKVKYT